MYYIFFPLKSTEHNGCLLIIKKECLFTFPKENFQLLKRIMSNSYDFNGLS